MADYYQEFSQILSHLTDEEHAWLRQQLDIVHVVGGKEYSGAGLPPDLEPAQVSWTGYRFLRDYPEEAADNEEAGFCFEFCDRANSELGRHLWIYADEYADLSQLTYLVQKFLRRFRPDQYWSMTYASTCSKPRLDAFGGGAVFVTADQITFEDSRDIVERLTAAFAESRPATLRS